MSGRWTLFNRAHIAGRLVLASQPRRTHPVRTKFRRSRGPQRGVVVGPHLPSSRAVAPGRLPPARRLWRWPFLERLQRALTQPRTLLQLRGGEIVHHLGCSVRTRRLGAAPFVERDCRRCNCRIQSPSLGIPTQATPGAAGRPVGGTGDHDGGAACGPDLLLRALHDHPVGGARCPPRARRRGAMEQGVPCPAMAETVVQCHDDQQYSEYHHRPAALAVERLGPASRARRDPGPGKQAPARAGRTRQHTRRNYLDLWGGEAVRCGGRASSLAYRG